MRAVRACLQPTVALIESAPLVAPWHKRFIRRLTYEAALLPQEWAEGFTCFDTADYKEGRRGRILGHSASSKSQLRCAGRVPGGFWRYSPQRVDERASLAPQSVNFDRTAAESVRGARLHDVLVKPLGLPADKSLIIIPHDALHHLPFQALWNGERYLIQNHAISYAPSLDSLAHIVRTRDASRSMKIVAFGNPDLGSDSLALPGAEREVNNIKVAYPDTLTFLRAEATKPRFVSESPRHAMVHIAAHAEFDALDPLYSRVRLAPESGISGAVEAHEIYKLDFSNTSLVTLSACESGMSRITRGDEIWGFTRSFLAAGAPALVLSLWPVADESTEMIMTTFYKEMREVNPREAIRRAQLAVSRDARFEHPFFWAPVTLVGDWR